MSACDFDLKITFVSSGWEGSATDSRVLRSAMSKGFEVPPGKFYLVDGGYANTSSFLAPYRGVRYHLKEFGPGHRRPQNSKELFNHRHALLRNHVERTLGVLKKRFPILKVATFHIGMKAVGIGREKYSNQFRFHILIRKRKRVRESSVGKTKSVMRDIEIGTIRSEACR